MDPQAPRTLPVDSEPLTIDPEHLKRLADHRAERSNGGIETVFEGTVPQPPGAALGPSPDDYARRMRSTPAPIVSLAERAKRKSADNVFDFPIPELDDEYGPFIAKVTKPSILSLIETGSMPQNLRRAVDKILSAGEDIAEATQKLVEEGPSDSFGMLLTVVNHMCIVGFVEPKVVATHEEAASIPGCIHYSVLPHEARMRFWQLIQKEAEEMAESAKTFPQPTVEPGDPGPDVRADVV